MSVARGAIQFRRRRQQIVDMSGMNYGKITPTDIDGLIDFHNERFAFFELKLRGRELDYGQKTALIRVVDRVAASGVLAALFVAEHQCDDPRLDIEAASCHVRAIYERGEWRQPTELRSLRETVDVFLGYWQPPVASYPRAVEPVEIERPLPAPIACIHLEKFKSGGRCWICDHAVPAPELRELDQKD